MREVGCHGRSGHSRGAERTVAFDPQRPLTLPKEIEHWSLTTLREKLVKIGVKIVSPGRYVAFQRAEDLMMGAPAPVTDAQLRELGIRVAPPPKR